MHPDLVCTAGFQTTNHFAHRFAGLGTALPRREIMRNSWFRRDRAIDTHAHRHARVAADRAIDLPRRHKQAVNQCNIFASHAARLQLTHKMRLSQIVARHHHQTGRVLVQTVHDPGSRNPRQLRITVQEAVQQRAMPVSCTGVRDQPCGLVHHNPVRAFADDIEGDRLGRKGQAFRRGLLPYCDDIARPDDLADLGSSAVDVHPARLDPALQTVTRMAIQQRGQHFIESIGSRADRHSYTLGFIICREAGIINGWDVCVGHEARSYNSACHPNTKEPNLVIFRTAALSNRPALRGSLLRAAVALSVALTVAGCSGTDTKYDKTAGWSAEQLYADAQAEMDAGAWNDARDRLTAIESRYPFGVYAQQALINLAYVNWKDGENEQALAAIDRFQQMYPNHPGTDYMLYLKGLINFTPASAFMSDLTGQDPAERDPKGLRASYDAFNQLIQRYPQSKYTPDAQQRVTWLVNAIAMNEVYVARYYYERGAYVAAANRAQTVITDFEGAPASEEALVLMSASYDKLGMTDLKNDADRVLKTNYPNSTLDPQTLLTDKSWWNPFSWK